MLTTLIPSLALAAGGILSVGSIIIVILLLISDRGWRNGVAYAVGYTGGYALIGVAAVLLGYTAAENNTGARGPFVPILTIVLGTLLLWMALRNWRKPSFDANENPRLFAMLDRITPPKAFGFGALITVINFKNLAIFLSAISIVLVSDIPLPTKIGIALLDALVFCAAVIIPVLIYFLFPQQAENWLGRFRQTLQAYSRPISIWTPLLFGLIFLGRGISGLF